MDELEHPPSKQKKTNKPENARNWLDYAIGVYLTNVDLYFGFLLFITARYG